MQSFCRQLWKHGMCWHTNFLSKEAINSYSPTFPPGMYRAYFLCWKASDEQRFHYILTRSLLQVSPNFQPYSLPLLDNVHTVTILSSFLWGRDSTLPSPHHNLREFISVELTIRICISHIQVPRERQGIWWTRYCGGLGLGMDTTYTECQKAFLLTHKTYLPNGIGILQHCICL